MNATDLKKIELPSSVSGSVLKEIMKAIPILGSIPKKCVRQNASLNCKCTYFFRFASHKQQR